VKWLNKSLIDSPISYSVCTKQKQFDKVLKKLGIDSFDYINVGSDATTHFLTNDDIVICIICINWDVDIPKIDKYALLVHEAVHLWQGIKDKFGETKPSKEFEAYSIQNITAQLFRAVK